MDPNGHLTMPNPQLPGEPPAGSDTAVPPAGDNGVLPAAQPPQPVDPAAGATDPTALPGATPAMPVPDASLAADPQAPAAAPDPTAAAQSPAGGLPEVADDNDLIEEEWVHKAKEIVHRTSADPHEQNKEINAVKADYIKKRYNREIKVNEA